MRFRLGIGVLFLAAGVAGQAFAVGPETSKRPVPRVADTAEVAADPVPNAKFEAWQEGFRARALEQGLTPELLAAALSGLTYDASVIERDRNQAEFSKTIWDYLDTAVSDLRVENGKRALAEWAETLDEIEATYSVEKEILVAIWGLESAYGAFRGSEPVINGLATLAFDARRAAFFEGELIAALKILQTGDTVRSRMVGSWAGAMGHTQFMPSSYQAYAVDFDGDGKRNIWEDDPVDALASAAAYLKHFGWQAGQPWGIEVRLPESFDYALAARRVTGLPSAWAEIGIEPVRGDFDDAHGLGSILLPGGSEGAAFLIFENFSVIEKYNTADAYVIGIGHLADRIAGGAPIEQPWPRRLRALTRDERVELQDRLNTAGYGELVLDAKMGPLTVNAVRAFQRAQGVTPDGYPSLDVLERLRAL
ncbi:MAG: lytic murein transglycosylase [Pseudomonadota bacterium]